MSRNTKIVLGIVAGALLLLCLCVGAIALATSLFFINRSVTASPLRVETIAREAVQVEPGQLETPNGELSPFDLPSGWQSDYAMKVGGFALVGYRPDSGDGHIMLAVLPETPRASIEELEKEVRGLAGSHGYRWNQVDMKVVQRKPITIRSEATEMVISEGTGSGGPWRQSMVSFHGERGLTLVIYGMPRDSYNQAEADALFASIR